jgi:ubiquinone/menaquinone biosynthesis C-methylase UbiE
MKAHFMNWPPTADLLLAEAKNLYLIVHFDPALASDEVVKNLLQGIILTMIDIKKLIFESGVQASDKIADFGAGSGFIASELAKAAGEKGELAAIDILEEPLEVLQAKARNLGLLNIRTIKSNLEKENGSTLEPNSMNLVMAANLLFQIENPELIVIEAKRILKAGGKVVAVEWQPEKMISRQEYFLHSPEEIKKLFEKHGFSFVKEFQPGINHYGLVYQK